MSGTITKTNTAVTFIATTRAQMDALLGQVGTSGAIYITTDTKEIFWADPTDSGVVKMLEGVVVTDALPKSTSAYNEGTLLQVINSPNNTEDGLYIACGPSFIPIDSTILNTTISTSSNTSRITITPDGLHSKAASFDIKGGSNVTVSSASETITISVPTPTDTHLVTNNNALAGTITNSNLSIGLSAADSASHTISGNVTIVSGNNIRFDQNQSGNIELSATNTQLSASTAAVSLTPASSTNGVKVVTAISDTASHTATGNFELVGADGIAISYANNVITLTGGAEGVIENIEDYVDSALADALGDLDAMKFKGAISVADFNNLNPSTFESGWAYKFTTAGTITAASASVDIGDMVIMSQDTNDNWIYNIIPSGDETDVYYTPSNDATNHQIKFTDNAGTLTIAHKIIGTNGITTTASVSGKTLTETIKHIAITPTSATAAITNNFVSAMTFDDYGHPKTVTYAPAHVAVTPTASSSTVTTFINGLTFDTYGHVTAYTSATVDIDTNMYWHTLS